MWVWQNLGASGFPWYGRMRLLAVEAQRAWPLDGLEAARGRNQHLTVPPGESITSWLTYALPERLHDEIAGVSSDGTSLSTATVIARQRSR
jgi:hypothetical protein